MAAYKKEYEVYERSEDGLLKKPEINDGYYVSRFHGPYESEEKAIEAIVGKALEYRSFLVVPVITYLRETDDSE